MMARTLSIDTVQADVHNLYQLLDTVLSVLIEMPRDEPGPTFGADLNRIDALVTIARDMAETASLHLLEDLEHFPAGAQS